MGICFDAALAALCVLGLALMGWWLFGLLLRPLPERGVKIILSGRGDGDGLEQMVRGFVWLRALGMLRCSIMIADITLTPVGRELALRLAARWPEVSLWPVADLPDYLSRM